MDINFNQLMQEAGEGYQPVPNGPYTVECEKAEATKSSGGKPQIRVTLRILGGPHNGRKLFDQFTLTAGNPTALGYFFDNMASFGLGRDFFSGLQMDDPMPYVAQMMLGRQCNVAVTTEQYQGVDRNKIKQYRPIAGGQQPANMPMQGAMPVAPGAMPGYAPAPAMGAMPVAQQPQFPPQAPPPGFPPQQQQPYAPQAPQPPVAPQPPAMPPQQEQAPWQQQPQYQQPEPQYQQPSQQYPQQAPVGSEYAAELGVGQPQPQPQQFMPQQSPQQAPQPLPPGMQQGAPQAAPAWQPSGPPPGYADPSQQQAPQGPPPMPQGVPPMPGVPGRGI